MMSKLLVGISFLNRTHESHEFIWNYPVKITVFNLLIVFIFLYIKSSEIIPSKFNGLFNTLKAMKQSALIFAVALACISVVLEKWQIFLESFMSISGLHFENDDHETAHKESSIDHLIWFV